MSVQEHPLFSESEVRALLQRSEGQFLEFKSLWDRATATPSPLDRRLVRDTVAESVAAFSNADGGTLVLGVEDDGTPSGHQYPPDALADIPLRRRGRDGACRSKMSDMCAICAHVAYPLELSEWV